MEQDAPALAGVSADTSRPMRRDEQRRHATTGAAYLRDRVLPIPGLPIIEPHGSAARKLNETTAIETSHKGYETSSGESGTNRSTDERYGRLSSRTARSRQGQTGTRSTGPAA